MQYSIEKAASYFSQGRYQDAIAEAANVLNQQPHHVDANLLLAAIHAAQSEYHQVVKRCEAILSVDPVNERANYNAAVASQMLGRYKAAIRYSRQVSVGSQSYIASRLILITSLYDDGQKEQAFSESRSLLNNNKSVGEIYLLLSRFFRKKNELEAAREVCKKFVNNCPIDINAEHEFALLDFDSGAYNEAGSRLDKILTKAPLHIDSVLTRIKIMRITGTEDDVLDYLIALNNKYGDIGDSLRVELGISYLNTGEYNQAKRLLMNCLASSERLAEVHHYLGNIYEHEKEYSKALNNYKESVRIHPASAPAYYNMGLVYERQGDYLRAIECLQKCVEISKLPMYKHVLIRQLSHVNPENVSGDYEKIITDLLEDNNVDAQVLPGQIISYLSQNIPPIDELIRFAVSDRFDDFCICMDQEGRGVVSNSFMLKTFLANVLIGNYEFEKFISMLRRYILACFTGTHSDDVIDIELCSAIGIQCVLNGFVYVAHPEEKINADKICSEFDSSDLSRTVPQLMLSVLSMYVSLSKVITCKLKLEEIGECYPLYKKMLKYQVNDPAVEREIKQDIAIKANIMDSTSVSVMNMYEESPYPVWKKINKPKQTTIDCRVREISSHSTYVFCHSGRPDILVAGCGTGRHAILIAMQIMNKGVTAIDLSTSSLAYAARMADEYHVHNIQFQHMDILNASDLCKKFDIITSVGVLHHMSDPGEGLRCLIDCLKPGGLINLGYYSSIGRRYIKEIKSRYPLDEEAIDDDIRAVRHEIMHSADSEASQNLAGFYDFYSLHECRDFLFHVSEHDYTLSEISSMLVEVGLNFIGFEFTDPAICIAYNKMFPADVAMSNLENWHKFEQANPDTFASMYVFWCYKPVQE